MFEGFPGPINGGGFVPNRRADVTTAIDSLGWTPDGAGCVRLIAG